MKLYQVKELEVAKCDLERLVEELRSTLLDSEVSMVTREVKAPPTTKLEISRSNEAASSKLEKTIEEFQHLREQLQEQEVENQMLEKECDLMRRKVGMMNEEHGR